MFRKGNLVLYTLYLADATLLSKVEKAMRIFEIFAKENPLIAAMLTAYDSK